MGVGVNHEKRKREEEKRADSKTDEEEERKLDGSSITAVLLPRPAHSHHPSRWECPSICSSMTIASRIKEFIGMPWGASIWKITSLTKILLT
jgi:hypothetical protein